MKNKVLLAGPWVGEFGWELFTWQGYVRKQSKNFEKTIVISKTGHEFLYSDFCDEFIRFELPKGYYSDSWFCRDINMNVVSTQHLLINFIKKLDFNHRLDPNIICNNMFLLPGDGRAKIGKYFYDQEYVLYKSNTIDKHYDIILHPRNKGVGDKRNWGKDKWESLVDKLKKDHSIAIIGNDEAFSLSDVDDYRNKSIEDTVSLLNRTKLIAGQSSGPLHLASLCGTPQLIWSSEHNRIRYEKHWNPFNIPTYFYSDMGWNPTVEFIYEKINNVLVTYKMFN